MPPRDQDNQGRDEGDEQAEGGELDHGVHRGGDCEGIIGGGGTERKKLNRKCVFVSNIIISRKIVNDNIIQIPYFFL